MKGAFPNLALGALLSATIGVAGTASAQTTRAVEFYHAEYGHFFVTVNQAEIDAIDQGVFTGWARTGESFEVLPLNSPSAVNVCRFWSGQTFVPKSSHFYTPFASECEIVKGNPDWAFEGEVFAMKLADAAGNCEAGTVPLYRLYNDGMSGAPNHRYTSRVDIFTNMRHMGWIPEGNGDTYAFACIPPTPLAPITTAEGIWNISVAGDDTGGTTYGVFLENSEAWVFNYPIADSIAHGTVTSENGQFGGVLRNYDIFLGTAYALQVGGTYVPRTSVSGSATVPSEPPVTFSGVYVPSYDQAVSTQIVEGTWDGPLGPGEMAAITVSAAGELSGSSTSGCQLAGSLVPRASGKNVLDLQISWGGVGCSQGAGNATGIGFIVPSVQSPSPIIFMVGEATDLSGALGWLGVKRADE